MLRQEFLRSNVEARDYQQFTHGTKLLIEAVLETAPTGTDKHILYLGQNLRRCDLVVEAANKLKQNKPLVIGWPDWLNLISLECLKSYHEESFLHLQRARRIMVKVRQLLKQYALSDVLSLGFSDLISANELLILTDDDWLLLDYASWYHDLCRMGYDLSFWETPGKFTPDQIKALEAHARLFFYLGEFFNVSREVVGLSVLHHYPNKHYPYNGIVKNLADLLAVGKFQVMLKLLINIDIYEGMTGLRGYRKESWPHPKVVEAMPGELGEIGVDFIPILEALFQKTPGAVICPH